MERGRYGGYGMYQKIHYLLFWGCFFACSFPLAAQNRIGTINQHSSDNECREYFQKNISSLDPIEGIYQTEIFSQERNKYRNFPIQKLENSRVVIYKESNGIFRVSSNATVARIGETMFYNYIADWRKAGGGVSTTRFSFNGTTFEITHEIPQKVINQNLSQTYINADTRVFFTENYIKEYPTYTMYKESVHQSITPKKEIEEWSGTGFALKNGYIATNYHVIENAQTIQIQGIKGDFSIKHNATVIATDKYNDLAILQISNNKFDGFGNIPYNIKTSLSEVGEEIFVLGYPLTSTMGDEIKLTTGVISSRTGFQGNVSLYQISAPIQSGNSGGPLFDNNGNLIGIVNAKHKGTENVGYAIKASYLKNLIESSISNSIIPNNNQTVGMTLVNKVKTFKKYTYMINCSNSASSSNNQSSSASSSSNSNGDIDIISPSISIIPNSNKGLKIKRVQVSFSRTIIDLEFDNTVNGSGWVSISPETYIISYDTGKRYTLVLAEGIPIGPQKYYFSSRNEKLKFRLIFPALPKNTTKFNLIENEHDNDTWRFYGIKLK